MASSYSIRVGVIDEATAKLKAINKQLEEQLAPQRRLDRETQRFYKNQTDSQKKWQSSVADAARSIGLPKIGEHFDKMALSSNKASGGIFNLLGAFKGFAGPLAAVTSVAAGVAALAESVSHMGEQANVLRQLQAVTGTDPGKMRAITGAGELNGVSAGATQGSMVGIAQAMQQAVTDPASDAARLYKQNGIDVGSVKKWQAQSPDKIMSQMADVFKRLKDQDASGATSAQFASINHIDPSLIPMLQRGGKAYDADVAQANKNNPWTPEMQKAGEDYTRAMADMQQKFNGLGEAIAVKLIPAAIGAADALGNMASSLTSTFNEFFKWAGGFFSNNKAHATGGGRGGTGGKAAAPGTQPPVPEAETPTPRHAPQTHGGRAPAATSSPASPAAGQTTPSSITSANMPVEAKALLETISGTESKGDYSVTYGGGHMTPEQMANTEHLPGQTITRGSNKGQKSSAFGKYQFINATYDEAAKALGLKDRSPESQDKAAWWLAQRDYKKKTGGDLASDLKDPDKQAGIAKALNSTWTSLPGSSTGEQGQSVEKFKESMAANTAKFASVPNAAGPRVQVAANENRKPDLGLLNVNIAGNVPGTKITADATGSMFNGPPKVQQTMASG